MVRVLRYFAAVGVLALVGGCGPSVVRGTEEPGIDRVALTTGLDKVDMDQMIKECLTSLAADSLLVEWRTRKPSPTVALFPFQNNSTEHVESTLESLAGVTESWLVEHKVSVIDRTLQPRMIAEIEGQANAAFNPAHVAQYGRQLGAKYFLTGRLQANDERTENARRVQYAFFMQAIEVETSAIKWQHRAFVTKMLK